DFTRNGRIAAQPLREGLPSQCAVCQFSGGPAPVPEVVERGHGLRWSYPLSPVDLIVVQRATITGDQLNGVDSALRFQLRDRGAQAVVGPIVIASRHETRHLSD